MKTSDNKNNLSKYSKHEFHAPRPLRQGYIQLIEQIHPTFAVTFNFNRNVGRDYAIQTLRQFEKRLNRKLKCDGLEWLHFIENEDSNTHFHSVVSVPTKYQKQFIRLIRHLWSKLATTRKTKAALWIDLYNQAHSIYNTKQMDWVDTIVNKTGYAH